MTMSDGTQYDITTGAKYVDPSMIIQMANGSYLDTKNNVLTMADGSRIVVNRHSAAQEIWVAAKSGGYHFRWSGSDWVDTRDGGELFASLSKLVSQRSGSPVVLKGG